MSKQEEGSHTWIHLIQCIASGEFNVDVRAFRKDRPTEMQLLGLGNGDVIPNPVLWTFNWSLLARDLPPIKHRRRT